MDNPTATYDKRLLKLSSCSFLNTYRRMNLSDIVLNLNEGEPVTTDPTRWNLENNEYGKIEKLWADADFNPASIKWINYYPDKHFTKELENDVAFYLRLNGVHRSWISRVDPGFYSPWHWDIDDREEKYLEKGEIKRYSVMMGHKIPGHIFMLGKDYLYDLPIGSIFRWNNYKDWHAGINAGLEPKFMFHLIGW